MKLEIKDSDGVIHSQECDDYKYNVDTKTVLCYEKGEGEQTLLTAVFENVSHFRKIKE
jgi:hypothetical protein